MTKKKIQQSMFDRIPEELQNEFVAANRSLDFNMDTNQLHITNCSEDLAS